MPSATTPDKKGPGKKGRVRQGMTPEQRSQRHLDRILEAATVEFTTNGYVSTNVGDIVARAHVSRSTFYEHFQNRDACFVAVLKPLLDGIQRAARDAAKGEKKAKKRTRAALTAALEAAVDDEARARLLLPEVYGGCPDAVQAVIEHEKRLGDLLDKGGAPVRNRGIALAGGSRAYLCAQLRGRGRRIDSAGIAAFVDAFVQGS